MLIGGPLHRLVALSAGPCGVAAAAVSETGDISDQHLAGAELVTVRASGRWVRDPLPGRRLYQLAQHLLAPMTDSVSSVLAHAHSGVP